MLLEENTRYAKQCLPMKGGGVFQNGYLSQGEIGHARHSKPLPLLHCLLLVWKPLRASVLDKNTILFNVLQVQSYKRGVHS